MSDEVIPAEWMKAALPVATLGLLARGEAHGYALLRLLATIGFPSVRGGTLYPLLTRQQEMGRVTHYWDTSSPGPARKVFSLTSQGREDLRAMAPLWDRLDRAVRMALSTVPNLSNEPNLSTAPTSGGQK